MVVPEQDVTDYSKVHVLVAFLIAFVLGALFRIDLSSNSDVNKAINEL